MDSSCQNPPPVSPSPAPFRMETSSGCLMAMINAIVLVIAILLGVLYGAARGIISPGYVCLVILVLTAYVSVDYWLWLTRGVRAVEVDRQGINIYRGKAMNLTRIAAEQISGINVFKKLPRIIVNIMTGGAEERLPGITLFSGPRVRITNDAFNDREFNEFVERIKKFEKRPA